MTNREMISSINIYDLLLKITMTCGVCIPHLFNKNISREECKNCCEICLMNWLNEEYKKG